MRYLLIALFLMGCPETEDAQCDTHPERLVCIDACIRQVDQSDCVPTVNACRAEPDRERCDLLLQACTDTPGALGCGSLDAGSDV